MADKMKVPFQEPDGSVKQEIGTLMDIVESKEPWSEYTLADGTKIRLKQTVISIIKLDSRPQTNGDPVYSIQSQPTMSVIPLLQ